MHKLDIWHRQNIYDNVRKRLRGSGEESSGIRSWELIKKRGKGSDVDPNDVDYLATLCKGRVSGKWGLEMC